MSGKNYSERTAAALSQTSDWQKKAFVWITLAFLWILFAATIPAGKLMSLWLGVRHLSHSDLMLSLQEGNQEAACEEARRRSLELIRKLQELASRDDRCGELARNALAQIKGQVNR